MLKLSAHLLHVNGRLDSESDDFDGRKINGLTTTVAAVMLTRSSTPAQIYAQEYASKLQMKPPNAPETVVQVAHRLSSPLHPPHLFPRSPFEDRLRKAYEFRIFWPPILPNTVFCKALLHIKSPCLIKIYPLRPHDPLHISLPLFIKACAGVTRCDIAAEIESAGGESGLHVRGEAAGQARVDVVTEGQGW